MYHPQKESWRVKFVVWLLFLVWGTVEFYPRVA